jgi:hypothetical protein
MASTKERAWLAAHQKGSKALVAKLDKAHANNPEYQAFKQKHGLGDTSSVKQVSKSTVDRAKEKARQTLAGKAYGATKGTRMGSAEGTGETLRDTIAPLTRDQHSAVKAAEREAKAAEKPVAAPKKPAKPKKEKAAAPEKKKPTALELIAAAAAKKKINQPPVSAKALRRIAAVGGMEHDHGGFEDLGDTQYGGRGSYSEEVELDEANYIATADSNPDMLAASRYGTTTTQAPKGTEKDYQKLLKRQIKNRMGLHKKPNLPEEVEQVEEAYNDDRSYTKCQECKKGKYVEKDWYGAHLQCSKCGDVVNRFERDDHPKEPGPSIPEVIAKNNKYEKALAALKKKHGIDEEVEQIDEMIPYALSAANYQAELRRQEKAKKEHEKDVKRNAKKQLDKDSEDTGNPFANWEKIHKESAPGWMLRQNPELAKKVKAKIAIAKNRNKQMGNPEPVKEAKKHHMGGALFADTAARLQKAINAHKERMDQMTNGPEHEYHHPTLDIRAKSRLKFPAPWVKVEDK